MGDVIGWTTTPYYGQKTADLFVLFCERRDKGRALHWRSLTCITQ